THLPNDAGVIICCPQARFSMEEQAIDEVVDEIIRVHAQIASDWKNVRGWAPDTAADLLESSRLDWLESLGRSLRLWTTASPDEKEHDGQLILAWVNLGSLVEGLLKFFLSVWSEAYLDSVKAKHEASVFKKLWDKEKQAPKQQDGLMLE